MARFRRLQVLNTMMEVGVIPVFYHANVATAKQIVTACAEGGARVIEFVNRGDRAHLVFSEVIAHFEQALPEVILGAGSVVDPGTASLYINAGAHFIVGPVLNADVARACNRRKIAYSPGCGSASEISAAEELGVEICKVFPGTQVGGPGFVKALLGPCPWTSIMPTGGVDATLESVRAWFKAGVCCVGVGSKLITKELVAAGDFAGLSRKVAEMIGWVQQVRAELK